MRTENAPYLRDSTSLCREKHYARPMPEVIIAPSQPVVQLLLFGPIELTDINGHDLPELSPFFVSAHRELDPLGRYIIDDSDEPDMNHVARVSYSPFMSVASEQTGGALFRRNVMFVRLQSRRPRQASWSSASGVLDKGDPPY